MLKKAHADKNLVENLSTKPQIFHHGRLFIYSIITSNINAWGDIAVLDADQYCMYGSRVNLRQ